MEERKQAIGTASFNQEFLNIPMSKDEHIIDDARIQTKESSILDQDYDYKVLAIDPAISQKESADFIGMCAIGHIGEDRIVLHSSQRKCTMDELADSVVALHKREDFNEIRVE